MYTVLLHYLKDFEKGHYKLAGQSETAFNHMPPILRIEENQFKGKVKTELIIRAKYKKWSENILTGLAPMGNHFYFGDHFKNGKKSLMLILITPDTHTMAIMYFKGFYPYTPKQREQLLQQFMPEMDKKKGASSTAP